MDNSKRCNCEVCSRLKYYVEIGIPEEVINHIMDVEMDVEYYKCILNGNWPTGKEVLLKALEKYK